MLFKPGNVRLRIFYTEKAFLGRWVFRDFLKEETVSELRMWAGVGVGVPDSQRMEKLVIRVESHASAVSLLESGEQRYIKVIHDSMSSNLKERVDKKRVELRSCVNRDRKDY